MQPTMTARPCLYDLVMLGRRVRCEADVIGLEVSERLAPGAARGLGHTVGMVFCDVVLVAAIG